MRLRKNKETQFMCEILCKWRQKTRFFELFSAPSIIADAKFSVTLRPVTNQLGNVQSGAIWGGEGGGGLLQL